MNVLCIFQAASSLGFREGNFGRRGGRNTGSVLKPPHTSCRNIEILINFSSRFFILGILKSMTLEISTIWKLANTTNLGFILQKENLMISTPLNQRISPHLCLSVQALPLGKMILLGCVLTCPHGCDLSGRVLNSFPLYIVFQLLTGASVFSSLILGSLSLFFCWKPTWCQA